MSNLNFGNLEMLLVRLSAVVRQGKKISVLVGSGLTCPDLSNGELGVSPVNDIIDDIKNIFEMHGELRLLEQNIKPSSSGFEKYQAGMQTLLSCFGQDELNKVIVRAVLNSMINKPVVTSEENEIAPAILEKDPQNWYLRKGVDSLGEMFVDFKEIFSGPILTSNFDPLIEISIKKHKGNPQSIFIINDGKFLNQKSDNNSVVHFHGYWHGSDTLHTTDQLKRDRPQLKGDLRNVLNNSVLIVTGYGGWNDVFTNTLIELINEGNNNFEVLWCFYEKDEKKIIEYSASTISSLKSAIGQRVILYSGIDCNKLFPAFLDRLNGTNSTINALPVGINGNQDEGFPCDTPPSNLFFVGRGNELLQLKNEDYKVCFITAIGGQGKSGLASHFVHNIILSSNNFEYWDWRDCKEEDNKFNTILVSQIERISKGLYRASKLSSASSDELIDLFFKALGSRQIVFVYDNVDRYIDLAVFKPTGGLSRLVEKALKLNHSSRFIFTCRPRSEIVAYHFMEIRLNELSVSETIALCQNYKPPINANKLLELAGEAHKLTNGHALWLNLFAAQTKRGLDVANSFLQSYRLNQDQQSSSITVAENILNVVWKNLNQKQQTLLRGMAEMVTSFELDELERIFASELGSNNQFNKAFNALNGLNLIVTKSSSGKKNLHELHPLVKEYVLGKYKKNDRTKFITLIVNFYDSLILFIKPKLDSHSPLAYFEKYTQKAELQIHNHDFKGALVSFHEISNEIKAAGFIEEYLRVSIILFETVDWLLATTNEFSFFHEQVGSFIYSLIERGRFDDTENYLQKYADVIPGKSVDYLAFCNLKSYYFWFKGDLKSAIYWAEHGVELQKQSNIGNETQLNHKLALALRDSKSPETVTKALEIFLAGEALTDVLSDTFSTENFGSEYFGNIGRCLWFNLESENALICYIKSFKLLQTERRSSTVLNIGYASLWIAEVLFAKNDERNSLCFLKNCIIHWDKAAPVKSLNIQKEFNAQLISPLAIDIFSINSAWDIEKICKDYVNAIK